MAQMGEATIKVRLDWDPADMAALAGLLDQALPIVIGRAVHYRSRGSADGVFTPNCVAAVVTVVGDSEGDGHGLAVLNPRGTFFDDFIRHDPVGKNGGTWHRLSECLYA